MPDSDLWYKLLICYEIKKAGSLRRVGKEYRFGPKKAKNGQKDQDSTIEDILGHARRG